MGIQRKTAQAEQRRNRKGNVYLHVSECPYCGRSHNHDFYIKNKSAAVEPTLGLTVQAGCEGVWRGGNREYTLNVRKEIDF